MIKTIAPLFLSVLLFSACTNKVPDSTASDIKKSKIKAIDPSIQKIIDTFFQKYASSPSDAIDYLFSTNKLFKTQQVNEIKDKLAGSALAIGSYNGCEQITTKNTSPSLRLFSYLVKHDNQPIRFIFIFYKPKDEWVLYKFKFDDSVDAELEESSRIYFIK